MLEEEETNVESSNTAIVKFSPMDVSAQFRSLFIDTLREYLTLTSPHVLHNDIIKIMVIDIPRKIWRPKIKSRYNSLLFSNDIGEIFLFEPSDKIVFCPKQ